MQLIDGQVTLSATDLVGFLACEHLTNLERAALAGLAQRPMRIDPRLDLVRKRGFEHEARYLERLVSKGRRVTRIEPDTSGDAPDGSTSTRGDRLRRQVAETDAAIRRGDDVIYQAAFFDGRWLGYADFLLRVDVPSELGPWSYEITDTKLAHQVRASALVQLCTYADLLSRIQGAPPEYVEVALGGSEAAIERHRLADYAAFYRLVRKRFEDQVLGGATPTYPPVATYPDPVEHCAVCRWWKVCTDRRREDDDLSLVAGISRNQRRELPAYDAPTRRTLAVLPLPPPRIEGTSRESVTHVREQARVQVEGEDAGHLVYEVIAPDRGEDGAPIAMRGLAALPVPSPGDLFLDFEGDPFALDDGLEYLVGIVEPGPGLIQPQPTLGLLPPDPALEPSYLVRWAFDRAGEKTAFEWLIDTIVERRRRDPGLHVYHYGSYESGRVARLSTRHATREEDVDTLLRQNVFVDLYRAVRQGVRVSVESYSIKRLEPLYGFHREVELREADKSIVEFERYLEEGARDPTILETIEAYNRDDCVSTWRLRDWLEDRRVEAVARFGELPRPSTEPPDTAAASEERLRIAALAERLAAGIGPDELTWSDEQRARVLLGNLLDWHWREEKSLWWRFFDLVEMDEEELAEQREPIVGLTYEGIVDEKTGAKGATVHRYRFEPQDNDVQARDELYDPQAFDPATWPKIGIVDEVNQVAGYLDIKPGKAPVAPHHPAVVPLRRFTTTAQRAALLEIGDAVAEDGMVGPGAFRAARDLLMRAVPRLGQVGAGRTPDQETSREAPKSLVTTGEDGQSAAVRLANALDRTTLAIQGPPGSGKTTTGAAMIVEMVRAGRKVGITALSHKVIGNLLEAIVAEAKNQGISVPAIQRADEGQKTSAEGVHFAGKAEEVRAALEAGSAVIGAGTSWLWANKVMRDSVDTLVVDEAGQMSLADVLAVSTATRNMLLLGDPQQLEQPLQGAHPPGAGASALEHILAGRATIAPHRGLFLEHTWRLHPAICRFTSEVFYEGLLESRPGLENQRIDNGGAFSRSGLRWIAAAHVGNRNQSPEEVEIVAAIIDQLLRSGARFVGKDRTARQLGLEDILVVAPYNAQVAAIKRRIAGLRVGTVDKFQGQEAPVVIYSMTTSSAEDAPRGMEFLYSLNRLNVATSRAKALAIIVCSPDLTRADVHTPRQMKLANALCRYLELAEQIAAPVGHSEEFGGMTEAVAEVVTP